MDQTVRLKKCVLTYVNIGENAKIKEKTNMVVVTEKTSPIGTHIKMFSYLKM